jgi:CheY-like chemotaxis protein
VLVVEDVTVESGPGLRFLRDLGHAAAGTSNGREALERLAAEPFDLCSWTCSCPRWDGFEIAAAARGEAPLAG